MDQYGQTIAAEAHIGFDTVGPYRYRRFEGGQGVFGNSGVIAAMSKYQHN
jgi:hypothetical protein